MEGISKYVLLTGCEIIVLARSFLVHSFLLCHTLALLCDSLWLSPCIKWKLPAVKYATPSKQHKVFFKWSMPVSLTEKSCIIHQNILTFLGRELNFRVDSIQYKNTSHEVKSLEEGSVFPLAFPSEEFCLTWPGVDLFLVFILKSVQPLRHSCQVAEQFAD